MIAIIFEVWPNPEYKSRYLDKAADLSPLLERIDGFISVERFESISEPGKMLSLSVFENEDALSQWRNMREHREAQIMGRSGVFDHYRLRVASVIRDYSKIDRDEVPVDSLDVHDE